MGKQWKQCQTLFFGCSKITADGNCSHEIKRCLLLGRKAMTNLESILKSRDITLPTKVCLVTAMVFPVVMYGCESWTIKKAECQRIDAFELWCWRRLLSVPWSARRANQSILKEISPECSLEGLMLKLKLQYLGHLMRRADSFEMTLMLGKIEGGRRGWQRMRWLDGITDWVSVDSGSWWWTGRTGALKSMGSQIVGHDWATELNWTEPKEKCQLSLELTHSSNSVWSALPGLSGGVGPLHSQYPHYPCSLFLINSVISARLCLEFFFFFQPVFILLQHLREKREYFHG